MKKKVKLHAVLMRIDRSFRRAKSRKYLRKVSARDHDALGEYFILGQRGILKHHVNVEELARKIGALKSGEEIDE